MRKRENDMEVADGQNLGLASLEPAGLIEPLAFGTMPISARVIGGALEAAAVAAFEVAAESGSPATLDGAENFKLRNRQGMGAAEVLPMEAQDIRQLPPGPFARPSQACRPVGMGRDHGIVSAVLLGAGDRQKVQRALGGAQFLAGDLEVALRGGDGSMAHEDLDGAQVDAGFQQMSGEGVPERMDASDFADTRFGFGRVEDLGNRETADRPHEAFSREATGKEPVDGVIPPPIIPQVVEHQPRKERIPVLVPFALLDTDHHPAGINVADAKMNELADAQAGAIGHFEEDAVLEIAGRRKEAGDLLSAEDFRQTLFRFPGRKGQMNGWTSHGDAIEELQARDIGVARAPGEFAFVEHVVDVVLDLPISKSIGGPHIPSGQSGHRMHVNALGVVGEPPQPHVTDHLLAQLGHTASWWDVGNRALRGAPRGSMRTKEAERQRPVGWKDNRGNLQRGVCREAASFKK